jgi:hypothetical protein
LRMKEELKKLKDSIYNNRSIKETREVMDSALYSLLDDYDHSHMIVYVRLIEMLRGSALGEEAERKLKVVDLIRFPIKKWVE